MNRDSDKERNAKLRQFFTTQTWWGKIIGAVMGYLMAGPTGAFFGILVGNLFDRGLAEHFSRPYWHYHSESRKQIQKVFFEATFSVMGHLAKKDGRVTKQEIEMASTLMREMRLSLAQKKHARELFREGKSNSFELKKTLTLLRDALHDNAELLKLFVEIQYRAAAVDGLSKQKMDVLNTILLYLGFAPLNQQNRFYEDFDYNPFNTSGNQQTHNHRQGGSSYGNYQHSHQPNRTLAQAFAILEIAPTASKQDVKRAYRRQMSKNHPDKLISQGLPEEMIRLANDKTQKIAKAYEQICQSKGW